MTSKDIDEDIEFPDGRTIIVGKEDQDAGIITAQINQYTQRPDLLLETIERHNPGFIKKIHDDAQDFAVEHREHRYSIGRLQAYTGIALQFLSAISILAALFFLIHTKQAGFLTFGMLAVFYAITQSGSKGFLHIAQAIIDLIAKK